jgi:anti-anti-sigma regulatory factor
MIELVTLSDSTIVCKFIGDLDVAGSLQLRHLVADIARPGLNLELDLRETRDVRAIGISAMIGAMRMMHSIGGTITITNASSDVNWFIQRLGCDDLAPLSVATRSDRDPAREPPLPRSATDTIRPYLPGD